jgi:hypothetical protein
VEQHSGFGYQSGRFFHALAPQCRTLSGVKLGETKFDIRARCSHRSRCAQPSKLCKPIDNPPRNAHGQDAEESDNQ